jgi:hypothetical protein
MSDFYFSFHKIKRNSILYPGKVVFRSPKSNDIVLSTFNPSYDKEDFIKYHCIEVEKGRCVLYEGDLFGELEGNKIWEFTFDELCNGRYWIEP